jgi:hypothetical protein
MPWRFITLSIFKYEGVMKREMKTRDVIVAKENGEP